MAGKETVRGAVVDERIASQPSRGPAPGPGVPELIPRWQQVRVLLAEFILEPAEGSFALDSPARASLRPARSPVIPSAKTAMSWYQTPGGQRVDDDQL